MTQIEFWKTHPDQFSELSTYEIFMGEFSRKFRKKYGGVFQRSA